MSYALVLSDNAIRSLREIEVWLAEETLDELEALADVPERIQSSVSATSVFDFTRERGSLIHYVFLVVRADKRAKLLQVEAIGHYARAAGEPPSAEKSTE